MGDSPPSFDYSLVRQQLQGFRLMDVSRIHKQGYPEHMVMSEFRKRFNVLSGTNDQEAAAAGSPRRNCKDFTEDKKLVQAILTSLDMNSSLYRVGISEIFFRSGVINHLYDLRDEKISATILVLQSRCRGFLARKRFEKRKVQDVAIRCLQRNIKLFMNVRQWPWWKLVTKFLPLIEVNRTEDELKETQAEVELLKEKLNKAAKEKEEILSTNEKFEHKVQEIMQLLEDEQGTASHALELLDAETKAKVDLQKVNQGLNDKVASYEKKMKQLEGDVANQKPIYIERSRKNNKGSLSTNDSDDSDDSDNDGINYKAKYERSLREFSFKMKEQKREHEDITEELREN